MIGLGFLFDINYHGIHDISQNLIEIIEIFRRMRVIGKHNVSYIFLAQLYFFSLALKEKDRIK